MRGLRPGHLRGRGRCRRCRNGTGERNLIGSDLGFFVRRRFLGPVTILNNDIGAAVRRLTLTVTTTLAPISLGIQNPMIMLGMLKEAFGGDGVAGQISVAA
jgi:hypothetical protein